MTGGDKALSREHVEQIIDDLPGTECMLHQLESLRDHDATLRARLEAVEGERDKLVKHCDEKSECISNDTNRFIVVTHRIKELCPEATSLENGIERLQQQLAAVTQDANVSADRIQAIETKLREGYPKLNCLSSMWLGFIDHATTILLNDIAAAEGRVEKLTARLNGRGQEIREWQARVTALEEALKAAVTDWKHVITEFETRVDEADGEDLDWLDGQKFRQGQAAKALTHAAAQEEAQELVRLVVENTALRAEVARLKEQNTILHDQLNDWETTLTVLHAERDRLAGRVQQLEEALKFSKEFLNQFAHGVDPENLVMNITIGDIEFAESVEQAIDNALTTAPVKKAIIEYGN